MRFPVYAIASSCLAWLVVFGGSGRVLAEEANEPLDRSAVLAPFVNDDTFIVAYLNLGEGDGASDFVKLLSLLPQKSSVDTLMLQAVGTVVRGLSSAGAAEFYVVLGLGDIRDNGGPLVAVGLKSGADLAAVETMLRGFSQTLSAINRGLPQFPVERRGPATIIFGTDSTIARYKSLASSERNDLVPPLEKLVVDGATMAAVYSGGPDYRRVVRELWPTLPEPLAAWNGELTDRWQRFEFSVKASPSAAPSAQFVVQGTDAAAANVFASLLRALPAATDQFTEIGNKRHDLERYLQTILDAVPPEVDGTRVVMRLPTDQSQVAKLKETLGDAVDATMESIRRPQRMQQFKQMVLAIHTYADKYKHLPPPSIADQNDRPLLSWRVAILPWIEERKLFDQFHLDEPWDSPHNRALIQPMPAVYADPALPNLAREGKTTFVVPVGPGTVFDTKTGVTFREITDGTSNTIMIVEVPADDAVIWTKPDDWEVDLATPWKGLKRTDRDYVTTGYCDGRASLIPLTFAPDKLRAVLTRDGDETVDWP